MSAIYFLIGCSVIIAVLFLVAFFWANKSGQHDDTYTPAIRILFEDKVKPPAPGDNSENKRE